MDFINDQQNLLWFCDNCIVKLESFKNNPVQTTVDVVTALSESINESLAELKNDVLETKELTKSLVDNNKKIDSSGLSRIRPWPSTKRLRETAPRNTPTSRPDVNLIGGTRSVEKGSLTVDTVAKQPEKFWIYLSRIAPHVNEDDISELVKNCLQIDNQVDVRKLVRKDADLKQFAFISFKVGIDKELKHTALDPSIWPKGIFFREFENLRSERDFWGPSKVPRLDNGLPSLDALATPSQ